jgi:capsular exopolysaccharide synthesis family protein
MTAEASRIASSEVVRLPTADASTATAIARDWVLPGAQEMYRSIYSRIEIETAKTIAVCSAVSGEGKTTVSLGLATAIAQDFPGRRILIVETDFERPQLAEDFALPTAPGFSEYLESLPLLHRYCRATLLTNLHLMPAGGHVDRPSQLLRSGELPAALDLLSEDHDLVVVDVPAILASSDAELIANSTTASILVVRSGMTPVSLVADAATRLKDNLRGLVLNDVEFATPAFLRRMMA